MVDHVVSPDGKYLLVNGEWILLPEQQANISDSVITGDVNLQSNIHVGTTPDKTEQIRNLAELCIDKLESGNMAGAVEVYTEAKKIDVEMAKFLFEGEYSVRIGSAYADIVETYLVQILSNQITHSSRNYGMGVISHDIDGNHKASALVDTMEIAFDNSLAFLGNPDKIVEGGIPVDLLSDAIDESLNIDTKSPHFKEIKNLKFNRRPTEGSVKQKYRIGLALETASANIINDVGDITWKIPYDDINHQFLGELRTKCATLAGYATVYTLKVIAIAIHEGFDLESWKIDFAPKITQLTLENQRTMNRLEEGKKRLAESERKLKQAQNQSSDCFIATAAFGTMYESKIDILRCLRDTKLMPSRILSPFVRFYYGRSPPIARYISSKPVLKKVVRILLVPIIAVVRIIVRNEFPTWTDNGNPF